MNIIWNHPCLKFLFSLNEIIQNNYYNSTLFFESYIFYFSLKMIRLFSISQIYFKKTSNFVSKLFFKTNPRLNEFLNDYLPENTKNNIDFVVSGKLVYSTTKSKMLRLSNDNSNDENNEIIDDTALLNGFIIYTEINNENPERPITYKKIIMDYPSEESHFECTPADFKFVLTEILIDDKTIMTNFAKDDHNYFVVGNKFTNDFIKYILNKYHEKYLIENDISLSEVTNFDIRILDQDVKQKIVSNKKYLLINKENYEVKE